MRPLHLVHPSASALPPGISGVGVELRLEGTALIARYSVRSGADPYVNPALPTGSSQWGLWDWDVVELFVSCGGEPSRTPYYEFQVSPLGQELELAIFEPRKRFDRDFRSGFSCSARIAPAEGWEGELRIPLDRLGWSGDPKALYGNAFAILGAPGARTYWSLFLGPQAKPDFHLPERFGRLVE